MSTRRARTSRSKSSRSKSNETPRDDVMTTPAAVAATELAAPMGASDELARLEAGWDELLA